MSALANVLLSTVVNGDLIPTTSATVASDKTFAPEGWKPGNVASWVDRSGGIPLGYPRLTFGLRAPTKESRVYKVSTKLYLPTMETIDPSVGIFGPKLAYELQAHMDCLIPERATAAERLVFLSLIRSIWSKTIVASDASPTSTVGSPTVSGVTDLEDVF
jgi:hypothetical protein